LRKLRAGLCGARRVWEGGEGKPEGGDLKPEDRSRKTEDGGRRSEGGGRREEDVARRGAEGAERREMGGGKPEGQRTEDGGQKTEDGGLATAMGGGTQVSGFRFQVSRGGVWVLAPLLVPLPKYEWVRRFNGWLCAHMARTWCRRLGFENPALINYVPVLAEAMRGWGKVDGFRVQGSEVRGQRSEGDCLKPSAINHQRSTVRARRARVVYHCVDRWDAFAMYDSAMMAEMDARCCRYADLVIASSTDLADRCRRQNPNTHLVLHGVDYSHFARALDLRRGPRPADLPAGPIVGFFGLLSEWIDQELLVELARGLRTEDRGRRAEVGGQRAEVGGQKSEKEVSLAEAQRSQREKEMAPGTRELRVPGAVSLDMGSQIGTEPGISPAPAVSLRHSPRPLCALREEMSADGGRKPEGGSLSSEFGGQRSGCRDEGGNLKPAASLVLIGQADVGISRLKAEPNIVLLGPKPFATLPGYAAHFDVGIIPFHVNELTMAVNPIKLREMLAAGCPVVSTALPEVRIYAMERGVVVADNREDFVAAVDGFVDRPLTVMERKALSDTMKGETWVAKVREMLGGLGVAGLAS